MDPRPAGPRPALRSRRPAATSTFLSAFAGALAMAALVSCISDGPNKTGGEYLGQHGILLQDPLFHVTIKGMPVDTFWTTDALSSRLGEGDVRHLGDTILLAGRSGRFTGIPRMTYQIVDTSMIDSLVATDSTTLRLSLTFPKPNFSLEELKATVEAAGIRDSMLFEVAAWDSTNADIANDKWAAKVAQWNGQYLERQDTTGALPQPISRDTILLKTKTAYGADNNQVNALPHLFKALLKSASNKHFVHLRLTPLPGPNGDSGSAMLRLGGWLGDGAGLSQGPLLLFGKAATASAGNDKNRLRAMGIGSVRAVNYALHYDGPRTNMLTVKQRGLHVVLNRATLLDSIDSAIDRSGKTKQPRSTDGQFDLSYFVPFAKMTLPLDSVRLEGGFPLEMRMISETDSLLGDTLKGGLKVDVIPAGGRKTLWNTFESGNPAKVLDEVSLAYEPFDKELRRVTLRFSAKDSTLNNDTLYIRTGTTKEWIASINGYGRSYLSMSLQADSNALTVRSYLTVRPDPESNTFKDPATGKTLTDLLKLLPHFLKPEDKAITLRATSGFQRLLNRAHSGASSLQDFVIQPSASPAVDTSVSVSGVNIPDKVPYPVLSVIPPKIVGGRLTVDVELYLFPLKAR